MYIVVWGAGAGDTVSQSVRDGRYGYGDGDDGDGGVLMVNQNVFSVAFT